MGHEGPKDGKDRVDLTGVVDQPAEHIVGGGRGEQNLETPLGHRDDGQQKLHPPRRVARA